MVGGQRALAARITAHVSREEVRVKQQDVWRWLRRFDGRVPAEFCIATASAALWRVTPHELRPDVYPHPDDGMPPDLRRLLRPPRRSPRNATPEPRAAE